MKVLVTGGLGYIGSHTVLSLLEQNHEVVIVDNLSNSKESVLERLETISGTHISYYCVDMLDFAAFEHVFEEHDFDAVIHFAAFKAVGESQEKPLEYYENNLGSMMNLLKLMRKYEVKRIVFSSSACVYGAPDYCPIPEEARIQAENVYGRTKVICEQMIRDYTVTDASFSAAILRYFNPIGAHKSGLIGEDPNGIPNNLMPYITQVAVGKRERLTVFGDDYDTPDGTGVRDYIHVCDLADGHVAVLKKLEQDTGVFTYNLGRGEGYSVLDLVHTFEEANGVQIPYVIGPRRSGDVATCYSDPQKANNELGWVAKRDLKEMCEDSWKWQQYAQKENL